MPYREKDSQDPCQDEEYLIKLIGTGAKGGHSDQFNFGEVVIH